MPDMLTTPAALKERLGAALLRAHRLERVLFAVMKERDELQAQSRQLLPQLPLPRIAPL